MNYVFGHKITRTTINPDNPLNWSRKMQYDKDTEFMGYVTLLINEHNIKI